MPRIHALDYIACQIYHDKCRDDGIIPLPWWRISAAAREGFRRLAEERVDQWVEMEDGDI